ncbi:P-type conjugative transfer protein TrbL [Paraburkholderia humisilvae]|nr:P-type conjugative transfer protein TrbL [Paraburkholderia humisilvae]
MAQSNIAGYQFSFLNEIDHKFSGFKAEWGRVVKDYAQRLFWLLVSIDFGWTTVTYVLDKLEFADILKSLIKKVMTICFFWQLLKMSDTYIPTIIGMFKSAGIDAGKAAAKTDPSAVTPDGIVSTGYDAAMAAFEAMMRLGVLEKIAVVIPITVLSLIIFLSFLFVAAQLLIIQIESYIAIGGGVILLGFGGSRWTTDMATKYLQYAVATGIKLMVLYMIVGAGQTLFDNLRIDTAHLFDTTLVAMGEAVVYAYLAISVPQIASAMMSGSPSLTAGGMLGAAMTVGAAAAGVGGAAMSGAMGTAKGAAGAAAGATGLAKALGAGLNSGLDLGKSGTALAAHTLGEVGGHGLGLAKGAVGDAIKGAKTAFAQKVDGSMGGKIASSIEASRGSGAAGIPVPPSAPPNAPAAQGGADAAQTGSNESDGGAGAQQDAADSNATSADSSSAAPPPAATASASGSKNAPPPANGGTSLQNRIRDLQGYVPNDAAHPASVRIDAKHAGN